MPRCLDGAKIKIAAAMYDAIADAMKGNANVILKALTSQSDTARLRIVKHGDYGTENVTELSCANASADNNFLDLIFNFTALHDTFQKDSGQIDYSPDGTHWTKLFDINSGMLAINNISSYWFEIKVSFLESRLDDGKNI